MARQGKQRVAKPEETETGSTSYSTRFDSKQRELIERAAALLGCAPAKLIRDAAVRRAADVVNARGRAQSESQVRVLTRKLAEHIFEVRATASGGLPMVMSPLYGQHTVSMKDIDITGDPDLSPGDVLPTRYEQVMKQLRVAMETCGTEFMRLLLEEWREREEGAAGEYQPVVSPEDLLRGEEKGGEGR